ncbi:hypothetical protein DAETH_48300 (plasmid) [Deinococcus aetherius]|uniref:Uncharacterized protein n=1 Tax=Deinococcus aetherius TaxID=200252 RepID=A0ABN6RSB9_9DEIO|nr:hypothetical protein [Deinococcus aetherius]BDP44861.1 hypothetical protein DAETH_48300 [Deinococcus aetherius]
MTNRSPGLPPYLARQQDADRNRRARQFRQFEVGAEFRFQPRKGRHERTGQLVTVVRPPRNDVRHPSLRVRFPDGHEEAVAPGQLQPVEKPAPFRDRPVPPEDPPAVVDARSRPAWTNLLGLLDELHALDQDLAARGMLPPEDLEHPLRGREPLDAAVRHRLALLAGMTLPQGSSAEEKRALAEELRRHAELDAMSRRALLPGRSHVPGAARLVPPPARPKTATRTPLTSEQLDQQTRRMHNVIARCIHRRYFVDDAVRVDGPKIGRHVRRAIRDAGRAEDVAIEQPARRDPRPSELHREASDAYRSMVTSALEVSALLMRGRLDEAHAVLERHREHRHEYRQASREVEALRPQFHTGRYFRGDILSVRDEHYDEQQGYQGMTQHYTRLTIVYGEDGHSVIVANAAELEAATGLRVGPLGWRDLCRWIEDTSDRHDGKKPGRRAHDDEHPIYREQEGSLVLRVSVQQQYPYLTDALECIRLALPAEFNDVLDEEIPEWRPARGFHPPPEPRQAPLE